MGVDRSALERAMSAVVDPELELTIRDAGMLRSSAIRRHGVEVDLALPVDRWPGADELCREVSEVAGHFEGVRDVSVRVAVMTDAERETLRRRLRAAMNGTGVSTGVEPAGPVRDAHGEPRDRGHGPASPAFLEAGSATRVVGISSGKGGVGKSTVTVNLGVALARAGRRVGILDADVCGFSIPKMLGVDRDPVVLGDMVIPPKSHGVRSLSMGFFVEDDTPVIWRGPMLHKAIGQFLSDAYWGKLDVLLVDMPPGTGDVTLSLAQYMARSEVLIVTTPQPAAQRVAQRSAFAARKLKLSVRGVVENMSWFSGDDGTRYELFGSGGGSALAQDLRVPLLGQIPLVPSLREAGDTGQPLAIRDPGCEAAEAFSVLGEALLSMGPAKVFRNELRVRS